MKLAHSKYEFQIDFNEGSITVLFFDDSVLFRSFVAELISQCDSGEDGDFILSNDGQECSLSENINIIPNPLYISFDNKRISSKLSSLLKSYVISEDMFASTQSMINNLEKYAEEITYGFQYPICYEKPDSSIILKLLNFKVEAEYHTELEKLLEYINLNHDICNIQGFIILNCFSYFSVEELELLSNECRMQGHSLLFIESSSVYSDSAFDFCRKIIVDKDGIEIF